MNLQKIAIITISSIALSLMPFATGSILGGASLVGSDVAHAKNGGGNSNAGSNGNAGGKSTAGNNKGNRGASSSNRGKSKAKSGNGGASASNKGGFFKNLFTKRSQNKSKNRPSTSKNVAKRTTQKTTKPIRRVSVDASKVPVPIERPAVGEKNLNAKLAGLNSLNRNYKAYMNANDPRIVAMREFIDANIAQEDARTALIAAKDVLADASAALSELTEMLESYDEFSYQDQELASLNSRLEDLIEVDDSKLTPEEEETLASEIEGLSKILEGKEAEAVASAQIELADAETAASETAASGTGDDALTEALLAAANLNRVEEYGKDNYVDQEMLNWANELLGTGDALGIIDQIREASEVTETTETAEINDDEPEIIVE